MKKAGTKIYQNIVESYCIARSNFEYEQKRIQEISQEIETAIENFNSLNIVDKNIEEWYEYYIQSKQFFLNLKNNSMKFAQKEMNKLGQILVEDYEEDLDKLYQNNKGSLLL